MAIFVQAPKKENFDVFLSFVSWKSQFIFNLTNFRAVETVRRAPGSLQETQRQCQGRAREDR